MRVRYRNPEGDDEYLNQGDTLVFTTDISIVSFKVPLEKGRVTQIIEAQEGDMVEYTGTIFKAREFSALKSVPLYEFVFMPVNDEGEIVSRISFVIKNVETILKWTEPL